MFVYYGRRYTARAIGSRVVTVRCEKCQAAYRYLLIRGAVESASAPYGMGAESAGKRARVSADQKMARRLESGVDPVACPDCGWYQADMIPETRRRRTTWVGKSMIASGLVLALVAFIVGGIESRGFRDDLQEMSGRSALITWLAISVVFAVPAGLWVWGWSIRSRFQPNDPDADHSVETRDAPVSARVGPDGQNEVAVEVEPVEITAPGQLGYERGYDQHAPGGWMTVQLATVASPPVCMNCLQHCTTARPFGPVKLPLAICRSCRSRSLRNGWLIGIGILMLYIVAAIGFIYPMSHHDQEDNGPLLVIAAIVAAVVTVAVVLKLLRPLRSRRVSVERNTVTLKFNRRPFAEEFFKLNRLRLRSLLDQQSAALVGAQKNTGGVPPAIPVIDARPI